MKSFFSFYAVCFYLFLASHVAYVAAFKLKVNQVKRSSRIAAVDNNGYGPIGSLLRQGPVPFFIRIVNPSTYDAAVEKYMALEKCDRITAQANMDAYFQDPNGWAANKLRSRKTGVDINYNQANMDPKSLVLTAIWSAGLAYLAIRIYTVQVLGQ
jgi:hypothetical protein